MTFNFPLLTKWIGMCEIWTHISQRVVPY